jgi:hypothetical protein
MRCARRCRCIDPAMAASAVCSLSPVGEVRSRMRRGLCNLGKCALAGARTHKFCKTARDVRFAPKSTELLRRREMSQRAKSGLATTARRHLWGGLAIYSSRSAGQRLDLFEYD